jgi:hypothetical protein
MTDDELDALRWLLGRGEYTEELRTADHRRIAQHVGEIGAREALIRVLRSSEPLNPVIRSALANAFEQPGSSAMRLELNLVRRKRGRPAGDVALAVEVQKRNAATEAEQEKGTKLYLAPEIAGKKIRRSRSTMYASKKAVKAVRQAKAISDGGN